ncbi:hypothetical protein RRG08_046109 [Elysia crispata]|uniref:UspA domain-containing protein n=1 Tax=Elysia crispata TaxID=231223 RepID=A0AAE1CSV1_9GAST|nr:hypothetical protein RRG08_046109 [Elysia crispata]
MFTQWSSILWSSRLPRRLRLGTVNRALIGSVSDYILHHAQCHVIVCRHKDHAHKDKERNHSYSSCRRQCA